MVNGSTEHALGTNTCKDKNVVHLRFLLSKKQDVFADICWNARYRQIAFICKTWDYYYSVIILVIGISLLTYGIYK